MSLSDHSRGLATQVRENRKAQKYPARVQVARVLWGMGRILFRLIPRPLYGPRNVLLRLFGAKIGRGVHISNTAIVYFPWELSIGDESAIGDFAYIYNLGRLEIGTRVTISQRVHLCGGTHDFRDARMPLVRCPIRIGDEAWICADAFVGPNVEIGERVVVGARSVVVRSVSSGDIVAGNPARMIGRRDAADE